LPLELVEEDVEVPEVDVEVPEEDVEVDVPEPEVDEALWVPPVPPAPPELATGSTTACPLQAAISAPVHKSARFIC